MTKRDLLAIAVKILGLVTFLKAIIEVPSMLYYATHREPGFADSLASMVWIQFGSLLLQVGIGLILIAFSESIARGLVRLDRESPLPDVGNDERPWFRTAVRVVGVVAVTFGFPILVGTVVQVLAVAAGETANMALPDKFTVFMVALRASKLESSAYTGLVQIALGAYLVWGAKQFTRLVFRDRSGKQTSE
jgi:hypothetical protein